MIFQTYKTTKQSNLDKIFQRAHIEEECATLIPSTFFKLLSECLFSTLSDYPTCLKANFPIPGNLEFSTFIDTILCKLCVCEFISTYSPKTNYTYPLNKLNDIPDKTSFLSISLHLRSLMITKHETHFIQSCVT